MSETTPTLSTFDIQRVTALLRREQIPADRSPHIAELVARMESCEATEPLEVDRDVVTMNSRVAIQAHPGGREFECCLVFPHQADSSRRMISVLAPFGAALLGARVGTRLEVMTPGGRSLYTVRRLLYQPESEAHYHL